MIKAENLYLPECKIIKATIVPKAINVIFLNLKTVQNTPKHYPKHPLLEGKVEFTFGLELSDNFQNIQKSNYFNLFNSNIGTSVSKLAGKKVSALILFNPDGIKKIDTIGIGPTNGLITLYNDLWDSNEIQIISHAAKLFFALPNKGKVKQKKI